MYLVDEANTDIADTVVACDFSFSGAISTDSPDTIIKGYIGSKATIKFLNDGKTFFCKTSVTNIQMISPSNWEVFKSVSG